MTEKEIGRFRADLDALAPNGRLGVAVSGGPDSLALLLLAHTARPGNIAAATVDHRLRPEAADEAAMVAALCGSLGVPHATLPVAVADDPDGVQAAARKARYAALAGWAEREGLRFLATAHHADDQAETMLMRLARGAGLAGLAGVRRSRPLAEAPGLTLIRPLLDWRKAELVALVAAAGLSPARDPSNQDERYDRTRARVLLSAAWPDAGRVAASARHLAEAEEALAWSAAIAAKERISFFDDKAEIETASLPRELRRRLLLAAFAYLNPAAEPRGDSVDRLLDALDRGEVATLGGFRCDPGPPWRLTRAAPRRSH
jgi:tRNA(Ile)-lysidine synthase